MVLYVDCFMPNESEKGVRDSPGQRSFCAAIKKKPLKRPVAIESVIERDIHERYLSVTYETSDDFSGFRGCRSEKRTTLHPSFIMRPVVEWFSVGIMRKFRFPVLIYL
jgi:hypothetical protein